MTDANSSNSSATSSEAEDKLQIEVFKALITSSLDYMRNATQVLHTFTSLLLTAHVATLVGFGKNSVPDRIVLCLLPVVLFVASLLIGFVRAATHTGVALTVGDFDATMRAYEQVISERRRQLIAPTFLTLCGITAQSIVIYLIITSRGNPG